MSFVETAAAAQAFRGANEPRPEANRELLALGLANLIGGLFHNMPSGGGTSQTAVNRQAGARSQIAGLVTAAAVVAVLFFLAPLVHQMPEATLAAVVVVPCAGMIRLRDFRAILQVRAMEFSWAVAALAGVVLVGTLRGILVAVVLSLLALIHHANRRPVFVLGRKPGTDVFRPRSREHPEDETFPGHVAAQDGRAHPFCQRPANPGSDVAVGSGTPAAGSGPRLQCNPGFGIHRAEDADRRGGKAAPGRDQSVAGGIEP